jgi:predicted homoserine dehydrogenase-like protein
VSYDDVDLVNDCDVVAVRREMEDRFKPPKSVAAQ